VIAGLVLAAGAGTRMGMPKALVEDESGPWLRRAVSVLEAGGCDQVTVVLGASADRAAALIPGVPTVVAEHWAEGMGASLREGLGALADTRATAVLVTLVDLPDLTADVVGRMLAADVTSGSLRRASYDGRPGHPVLIGRNHLDGVIAVATGDRGARDYLAAHPHELVECGDLATGLDVDAR